MNTYKVTSLLCCIILCCTAALRAQNEEEPAPQEDQTFQEQQGSVGFEQPSLDQGVPPSTQQMEQPMSVSSERESLPTSTQQVVAPVEEPYVETPAPMASPEPTEFTIENEALYSVATDAADEAHRGNWFKKLKLWEKSRPAYEIIRKRTQDVKRLEKELLDKIGVLEIKVGEFYKQLGSDETFMRTVLARELERLRRKQVGSDFTQVDAALISSLERIEGHVHSCDDLRANMSKVGDIIKKEVEQCEEYEERALNSFERIENILDDQKAKQLYDVIENAGENSELIENYIKNQLNTFIDQGLVKVDEALADVPTLVQRIEACRVYVRQVSAQEMHEQQKARAASGQTEKTSWWHRIIQAIKNFFSSLYQSIFGSNKIVVPSRVYTHVPSVARIPEQGVVPVSVPEVKVPVQEQQIINASGEQKPTE